VIARTDTATYVFFLFIKRKITKISYNLTTTEASDSEHRYMNPLIKLLRDSTLLNSRFDILASDVAPMSKSNSYYFSLQYDIDDLKRQNGHLEAQIRALERAKSSGNFSSVADILAESGLVRSLCRWLFKCNKICIEKNVMMLF
jgi:hypothetical protein